MRIAAPSHGNAQQNGNGPPTTDDHEKEQTRLARLTAYEEARETAAVAVAVARADPQPLLPVTDHELTDLEAEALEANKSELEQPVQAAEADQLPTEQSQKEQRPDNKYNTVHNIT